MGNMEIGGRSFRDIESFNAARADQRNIERMKERCDLTDIEQVRRLLDNIESGRYSFQSMLGEDFKDELRDLLAQLEKEKAEAANKGKKPKKTKSADKALKSRDKGAKAGKAEPDTRLKKLKGDSPEDKKLRDDPMDAAMKQEVLRQLKLRQRRQRFFIAILGLVVAGSVGYLAFYFFLYGKNDAEYKELASLKQETTAKNEVSITYTEQEDAPPVLKKYETLYQKNKKLVGWIKIEGTNIDYPVMQTSNNDYYLEHNYNQEYDKNGSIFLDCNCTPAFPNDNMIIYGHNMKSGKMFGSLANYAKESFYKEHPSIQFDTIYEEGTYDIMYVFRSKIYSEEEIVFKYYQFIDATSENEFYSNMEEMEKLSLYDTGITAKYGDKLITLSTCNNSETNGRFVVVAKKVK